jgi:transposase
MKRKRAQPVYKEYTIGQIMLLPVNLDELIPENHLVRVVNRFVEQMDIKPLEAKYKGGGTSSYHPRMMLKVFSYAYAQKIYSSRRIAKALRESVPFMWLSGNNRPDHRTINNFRGQVMKGVIEEVFVSLLELLIAEKYVKLEDYFVDGTKLEANANRYTFVWGKNTKRFQGQLEEKVKALFEEIERINVEEEARYGDRDLEEVGKNGPIDETKLAEQVEELNERLKREESESKVIEPEEGEAKDDENEPKLSQLLEDKLVESQQKLAASPDNKPLAKAVKQIEDDYLPRAKKYEEQEQLLGGRNSYSKTDTDATFMRMKDDHMRNGQLKPGYNIQIGTENQFVVGFSLHQGAGDMTCLIPHLEKLKGWLGQLPEKVSTDAGYGSEENYAYLTQAKVGNYLKYGSFDREQKKRYKPDPFKIENMPYDREQNWFTCPTGKHLLLHSISHPKTKNGYVIEQKIYQCEDCSGCPLKEKCTRVAGNRRAKVNFQLWEYRKQARENLLSEEGQRLRSRRSVDVEPVFGRIKECWGYRRFFLRGLDKVTVEWGLLCIAHDLAKVWSAQETPELTVV